MSSLPPRSPRPSGPVPRRAARAATRAARSRRAASRRRRRSRSAAGETREKLLAATHELLYERVGGPVSVNEICTRAGANVAMVKYCFGSKDAMMVALIDRIATASSASSKSSTRADLSASDKLRIHIARDRPQLCALSLPQSPDQRAVLGADAKGVAALSRNFALPARDWYRRSLAEGHASGEFRDVDPTLFFFTVIGIAEFFFTAQPLLREFGIRPSRRRAARPLIEHVTEIVLHGVQPIQVPGRPRGR